MTDLKTAVVIDLKGNLEANSKRYERSLNRFSKNGRRDVGYLNNSFVKHGAVLKGLANRYTGLLSLAGAFAAAGKVIDFDAQLTRMQTDGQATAQQIAALKQELNAVANDPNIRVKPDELLKGFSAIIEATGDFPNAFNNLRTLGLFMQGTGTAAEDAGNMIAISFKNGVREATEVLKILDVQTAQSLTGSVSIRDSARVGKGVYAPLAAATGPGKEALIEGGAVMQIAIDATKSADEAQEAMKSLLSNLQKSDVQKTLAGAGINVRREGSVKIRKLSELIPEIYKAAGGDFGKIGELFGESGVKVFQGFAMEGNAKQLMDLTNMQAEGLLIRDAAINARTAKSALQSIKTRGGKLADTALSTPTKELAASFDLWEQRDIKTNLIGSAQSLGGLLAKPINWVDMAGAKTASGIKSLFDFSPDAEWRSKQPTFTGTIKIELDQHGRLKTKEVKSNNRDIDIQVDNGLQVGSP